MEPFGVYKYLAESAWKKFDRKCDFEWRFSFGIWGGISALILLSGKTGVHILSLQVGWRILLFSLIIFIHSAWLIWIQGSLNHHRKEMIYWKNKIRQIVDGTHFNPPAPNLKRGYFSPGIQISVSIIFSFVLLFLVKADVSVDLDNISNTKQVSTKCFARDSHESLNNVLWIQTSAEYQQICRTIYSRASELIPIAKTDRKWTAALEQTQNYDDLPMAIIVDIDETVLDNSKFLGKTILKRGSYSDNLWNEWVSKKGATAVPGALDFLKNVDAQGITIFYITNRHSSLETDTRENLARAGFPISSSLDSVLCLKEKPEWTSDKTTRRQFVSKTHRVLFLVGDDLGDFVPGAKDLPSKRVALADKYSDSWGKRWFLLPNPDYGSWEQSIYGNEPNQSEYEILKRKFNMVVSFH